jgi:hypothetical protein
MDSGKEFQTVGSRTPRYASRAADEIKAGKWEFTNDPRNPAVIAERALEPACGSRALLGGEPGHQLCYSGLNRCAMASSSSLSKGGVHS